MSLLKIEDIAKELNISVKSVRNKLSKAGLKKAKTDKGNSLYLHSDLLLLKTDQNKYYPIKTTVTYHIYESKMNYEN